MVKHPAAAYPSRFIIYLRYLSTARRLSVPGQRPTPRDAIRYFAAFGHCHKLLVQLRWPEGKVTCPQCGSERVCYLVGNRVWKCYAAHPQPRFSLKTGTIFHGSPIPWEKWLPAAWIWLNSENAISSWQLHRTLNVTQKTAWFMLHRIRLALEGWSSPKTSRAQPSNRKAAPFEMTAEFARFRGAIEYLLGVSKSTLDERVARARAASPRRTNPHPPGLKPRPRA